MSLQDGEPAGIVDVSLVADTHQFGPYGEFLHIEGEVTSVQPDEEGAASGAHPA